MSGIAGLLDLRGAPADERVLRRMTDALRFRGPDGCHTWTGGPAGLGHTLLSTTTTPPERQPCTLGAGVWIVADARIDDRRGLVALLESAGPPIPRSAGAASLILHAYLAWGEACVERLTGDFAFAIWDGPAGRLFCARDRFGIKPFYYAHTRGVVVFSNTLECVRLHPSVGDALNERAVGDFLLFGFNEDAATTTFAEVQRLPPAHTLTVRNGAARLTRYWTLAAGRPVRYRRPDDYVDHLSGVLRAAVEDRLPEGRAGVWMSGGLDSTAIAATAREVLTDRGGPHGLRAFSILYDDLLPDAERVPAELAAASLGIPIHHFRAGAYEPFHGWNGRFRVTPEPAADPFLVANSDQMRQAAAQTRVLLCGDGGDEVLTPSTVASLLGSAPPGELAAGIARSWALYRRRPPFGIRAALNTWLRRDGQPVLPYPAWLDSAFEARCGLRDRWAQRGRAGAAHPLRPEALRKLTMPFWPSYFESWDAGARRVPVEARYPFFDVRLVEFLLAIPPVPWCVDKLILRESMRARLPEAIRVRRKTPLAGDPLIAHLERSPRTLDAFDAGPALAGFVDRSAIPPFAGLDSNRAWLNVRPLCLDYWLKREGHHEVTGLHEPQGQDDEDGVRRPAARRLR